ncbi:MAG: aminotransferase class I/II-fold pyridoxal phosphate-dependent enzyme [Chloroflexi bacterium]|nr:aminotransferase class I/II-fold pyridoxal phosphate-dependent enzyme [Chloroflexota bacterium]
MAATLSLAPDAALGDNAYRLDFRSDTITQPTQAMREAMGKADVGDDVFGEDPSINALEARAAHIFGKEAGLFVTSGTQGNLLALLSQTHPGEEVIAEASAHIANAEVGGAARLGGLTLRTVVGNAGKISPEQVTSTVRPENVHFARTTLLAIENTHNNAGGTILTLDEMDRLAETARGCGLKIHVDGARIFNAAVGLGVEPARLAQHADTLTFCLSKGLSAPVGSVLVGSHAVIDEARRYRKMIGAGMRQAGVLAAAGLVALDTGVSRLADDHRRARRLAEGLARVPGISIDLAAVQSNIVRFDVGGMGISSADLAEGLERHGVRISGGPGTGVRMVAHRHIDDGSVDLALEALHSVAAKSSRS